MVENLQKSKKNKESGITVIPTVLIMTAIILELVIVGAALAAIRANIRLGGKLAAEAYAAARAGAQDAALRVIRYKNCPVDIYCPQNYQLAVGSQTADISISESDGIVSIESKGQASTRSKKVRMEVSVESLTGEVKLQSLQEIPL